MLEALNGRMSLQVEKMQHLKYLQKGLDREKSFDSYTDHLSCSYLVLRDIQIEMDHTYVQIDSLIITKDKFFCMKLITMKEFIPTLMGN